MMKIMLRSTGGKPAMKKPGNYLFVYLFMSSINCFIILLIISYKLLLKK